MSIGLKIEGILKGFILFITGSILLFFLLFLLFPLKVDIEFSKVVTARDGTILHSFLTSDEKWRLKTELSEISEEMQKAITHKEDRYFYSHFGVNPIAVARAAAYNITTGKRTSGASTISMQVARMLNRKPRTYGNKIKEMFRAMQLEVLYSKKEILQLYLNLVPYGGNIEGVKSASVFYLGKSPDQLSIAELTALSIIPNRPTSLVPGKNNERIQAERDKWLKRYQREGVFSEHKISDALDEDFIAYRKKRPQFAPHYCYRMQQNYPEKDIIKTFIDLNKQIKTEEILKAHIDRLYANRIRNASAIVVDNESKEILVYVGSADFYNQEDGGQVDGVQAIRSPGSTLKPLIYAAAFDKGIQCPKTVINDVPINFAGYTPENFDRKCNGRVSVEEALALSLNIPAVSTLNKLETETLVDLLSACNFQQISKDRNKLGLSLALGGCGVRLEELAALYAMFANEGEFQTLKNTDTGNSRKKQNILSPSASYMLSTILSKVQRPDLPSTFALDAGLPKIAWKTGTSYGRRDAWSVGYNNKYTVAVWVGNFSGEGVPEIQGSTIAAPLLFEIFNNIDRNMPAQWFTAPAEIDERWVCSVSGEIPDHYCKDQVLDYYIPGVSVNKSCTHLSMQFISNDSTISYCRSCLPDSSYLTVPYANFDPALISFYDKEFIQYKSIPPHESSCTRIYGELGPEITSLKEGLEYYLDPLDNMQLELKADSQNDVQKLSWFIDDKYVETVGAKESLFFTPKSGKVKISCTDDKGRNTDIEIKVFYL